MILFSAQLYARSVKLKNVSFKKICVRHGGSETDPLLVNIHRLQYVCVYYSHISLKPVYIFSHVHVGAADNIVIPPSRVHRGQTMRQLL